MGRYAIFEARDAIGGTWDLFRYPGIRSDSDMFTLGYSLRPWQRTRVDRRRCVDPAVHPRHGARDRGRRPHPVPPPHRARRLVDRRRPLDASRPSAPTPARPCTVTAGFLFSCSGYYRYDQGYTPDFPGRDDFRGHDRPPAGVARRPRLRRQARRRDRQRRHGHHAHSSDGRDRRRTSRCCSARPATWPRCPAPTRSRACCTRCCPSGGPTRAARWVNALGTQAFFQVSQRRPALVKKILRRGRRAPAPARVRRRHPLHAPLRPVGPAPVRRPRRRPVPGHPRGSGLGRDRHDRRASPRPASR